MRSVITFCFSGRLVAQTPIHVGSGEGTEVADSAIARDHDDRGVLWGTSLTGVIRELAEREAKCRGGDTALQYLFGKPAGPDTKTYERESRLWVFDCPAEEDASFAQDRTSISPETGTVVQGRLFTEEHAKKGTTYRFRLHLDVEDPEDKAAAEGMDLLRRVLEHLEDGAVRCGGKGSIGRGRIRLADLRVHKLDWAETWQKKSPFHVAVEDWKGELASPSATSPDQAQPAAGSVMRMVFEAQVSFPTPIMVQQPLANTPVTEHPRATPEECGLPELPDHVRGKLGDAINSPVVEPRYYDGANYRYGLDDKDHLYLPGSSVRGAMRGRLLSQVRSRHPNELHLAWDVSAEGKPSEGHPPRADAVPASKDHEIRRDKPDEYVCLVSRLFGYAAFGGTIFIEDMLPNNPVQKGLMHVAVDRITRAPGEGKLFAHLVLWPDRNFTATLRIELLDPSEYDIGVATLLLKDIYRGHIRLGHGRSIGQGRLGLRECTITAYATPDCEGPPRGDDHPMVGSFEKRSVTIATPSDPIEHPSWVPEGGWFDYLSGCAAQVTKEIDHWHEELPTVQTTETEGDGDGS